MGPMPTNIVFGGSLCRILLLGSLLAGAGGLLAGAGAGAEVPADVQWQIEAISVSPGSEAAADLQWFRLATHCHSGYSRDSDADLATLLQSAVDRGADAFVVNDHGTYAACDDPVFLSQESLVTICGQEWSGIEGGAPDPPHAGIFNVPSSSPIMTGWPIEEMVAETHAAGGAVIAHHPFMRGLGWPEERLAPGIDAVEVWNGTGFLARNPQALAWWQTHLQEGRRITGVGGTDLHVATGNPLAPCNHLLARSVAPEDLRAAIVAGRVSVSDSEWGPRVALWADADGSGEFAVPMGANVKLTEPTRVTIRAEVLGGAGMRISLHTHRGLLWEGDVPSDAWALRASARLTPSLRTFLRAEIRSGGREDLEGLSNPIYLNFPPRR